MSDVFGKKKKQECVRGSIRNRPKGGWGESELGIQEINALTGRPFGEHDTGEGAEGGSSHYSKKGGLGRKNGLTRKNGNISGVGREGGRERGKGTGISSFKKNVLKVGGVLTAAL